jgi:chromosome segregation ATPase
MRDRAPDTSAAVIEFPQNSDPLERAGQDVLTKLHRAAQIAEESTQQAIAISHKLSGQLRAAEDRIRELEGEYWTYRHRAERAEGWLQRISQEIDQTFFASAENRSDQSALEQYAPKRLPQRER